MIFILPTAAASIEDVLSGTQTRALALDAWRIAALLGVDLHMLHLHGGHVVRCHDLLHYWQTHDPFFLTGPAPRG